jgi:hypothetical protein
MTPRELNEYTAQKSRDAIEGARILGWVLLVCLGLALLALFR